MNTSTTPSLPAKADAVIADVTATAEQQAVLARIAAQRERITARRSARAQTLELRSSHGPAVPTSGPLAERVIAFARLHPMAVAAAAGVTLMLGPRRVLRWATVALPLIARFRR